MKFKKLVNLPLLLILHFERVLISYKSLTQDFKSLIDLQIYIYREREKTSNLVKRERKRQQKHNLCL